MHCFYPFHTSLIDKSFKLNHLHRFIFIYLSFSFFLGHNVIHTTLLTLKNSTFLLDLPFLPFVLLLLFLSSGSYGFRPIPFFFLIFYLLQGCKLQGYMFVLQSSGKVWITLGTLENVAKNSSNVKNKVHFKLVSMLFFCEEATQFLWLPLLLSYSRNFSAK